MRKRLQRLETARVAESTHLVAIILSTLTTAPDHSQLRVPNREAEKEKGLLEKRLQRLEEARAAESAQLGAELRAQRDAVATEMSTKDNKINDLVEELGATQALLTEKEAALQEVRLIILH